MANDDLLPFGWGPRWMALAATAQEQRPDSYPARVIRHDGVAVLVAPSGASLPVLPSVQPVPLVGDWVMVTDDVVVGILERTALLRRESPGGGVQPLVANLDVLLIVCGLDRPVKAGRIQRSVTLAWDAGAKPVVILTKSDLVDHEHTTKARIDTMAANPGVEVVITSTTTGQGLDEVKRLAQGQTIVLLGESGAGKSTLTNALVGDEVTATGDVRASDAKGRHTTTRRELHVLPSGGVLVDTPGIRGVALWTDAESLAAAFDDVDSLAIECRFNDCAHQSEPGCAVRAAVQDGSLAIQRLDAWLELRDEAAASELRANEHALRAYQRQFTRAVKGEQKRKRSS